MANYNPVYKSIWNSRHFGKLNPNEKLVYLYLITNKLTSQSGILSIKVPYISCDCGLLDNEVVKILEKLDNCKMIKWWVDDDLIYIHKFFKYSKGTIKNPITLAKSICREFELLNNIEILQLFTMEYNLEIHEIRLQLEKNLAKAQNDKKTNAIEDTQELIENFNKLLTSS